MISQTPISSLRTAFMLGAVFAAAAHAQFIQQGNKLLGSGYAGASMEGNSVALSSDGTTLAVGGPGDNNGQGAVWVFTRSNGVWTQQAKLSATGATSSSQGSSVGLSADGNTLIEGGPTDGADGEGAAWIFTRSGGVWTQQAKLAGTGATNAASQGAGVALSADGNTAIVGGPADNNGVGGAWVFSRTGTTWTQQGSELVGTGVDPAAAPQAFQGSAVALSGDGNTALVGGFQDNGGAGAAWVFVRSSNTWTQQGLKLVGSTSTIPAGAGIQEGFSVALSGDGNTALVGGWGDNSGAGATWVFTRANNQWTQQAQLIDLNALGQALQGWSVSLSKDGNTALVGGPLDNYTGNGTDAQGAAWVFTRSNGVWASVDTKLVGIGGVEGAAGGISVGPSQGWSVAISADGSTAALGGNGDNSNIGAAWVFAQPHFTFTTPSTANGGVSFNFGVSVHDANNTALTSYAGTVHFSSTDSAAVLPSNSVLSGGTGSFPATLKNAGSQTITATDAANSGITGTSSPITVSGQVATHFSITAPGSATSGTAFQFTVTALDASNNTVGGYSGTVHFTSSDGLAVLPANSTLSSGVGNFSATLKTGGSQTITATDAANSGVTGISNGITVASGTATHFSVSAPSSVISGTAFNFTVTAKDASNNTVTGYSGTAHFTSSDGTAVLPANSTLSSGVGSFSATLKTTGLQTVSAVDTVNSGVTGISGSITVTTTSSLPPAPLSVTPAGGTAATTQTMTIVYSDPRGYQDLGVLNVLVNNFIDGRHACYLAYVVAQTTLVLVDDGGDAGGPYPGSVALGSSTPIQNSQCSVVLVSAQGSGNNLTLVLTITWTTAFAGDKIVYTAARDAVGNNSGWYPLGVVRVPGGTPTTTTAVVSLSPFRGTGLSPTQFTFNFSDTKGYLDLGVENILVNSALDGGHACYLAYSRPASVMYLVNDGGTALLPGQSMAASGSVSNSQCSVSWSSTPVATSGNNLTLTLTITFTSSFGGNRIIYVAARDVNEGNSTDWHALGTWTPQ